MLPRPLPTLLLLLALSGPLGAASPREELLRYVPDDVGFCLVWQNLRGHMRDLAASPFGQRLRESATAKALRDSEEWKRLQQAEQYLEKHLGTSPTTLADQLFGDAFAFAYRPGPPLKPEEEQGLFLLRARDEKTLAAFVVKFNALQKETGELKSLDELEHKGVKYFRRREANTTNYYYLNGPVLLFSGQEALLRQAAEREKTVEGDSPLMRQMRELKLDEAMIGLLLNPRAWDAVVAASKPADPAAKMASRLWKALGGVGLGVHLQSDLRIRLTFQMKTDELPASARKFLAEASKPSELWSRIPAEALFAAGGRLDVAALYEFVGECVTKQAKQTMEAELDRTLGAVLGHDLVNVLLPALGPDLGVWLVAPPSVGKVWTPQVAAAFKLHQQKGGKRGENEAEPIDQAVLSAVRSVAVMAILGHNKQNPDHPLRLRASGSQLAPSLTLYGAAFPPGVAPFCGLRDGYLVFASSYAEPTAKRKSEPLGDVPLLRASLKEWRTYLQTRREPLAEALALKLGLAKGKALTRIETAHAAMDLFDRVELRQQASNGLAVFTLTLTPTVAMKPTP